MTDPSSRPAGSPGSSVADLLDGAPPADFADPALRSGASSGSASATAPVPDPAPESFESALTELERIVQRMESGSLSLEDSLTAYRRGASLVGYCRQSLADVQQQVRILEADLLRPFDLDVRGGSDTTEGRK